MSVPLQIDIFPPDSFPHFWRAEILSRRPLILPPRHYTYPLEAEEVERGALEVLVHPGEELVEPGKGSNLPAPSSPTPAPGLGDRRSRVADPFLATCALGFRDPAVPTGIWSAPNPREICAAAGGYAYLIDTTAPERFSMIPYRPVLQIFAVPHQGLLLFVASRSILAWGAEGKAWESERLSSEGITVKAIEDGILRGTGWDLLADKELPFALDLGTGARLGKRIS